MPHTANQKENLRRSEERFQKLVEEVADYAILLLSPEGIIETWNPGAERIKGYKAEEIIGRSFRVFYLEEDQARGLPETLIRRAQVEGRAVHEGWRVRKDGTRFWGSVVITALHDDQGQVIGFGKLTRDLSQAKMAEDRIREYAAELELKNRELEQFAYAASHDLREPLRKIMAFSDRVLGLEPDLGERSRDYLQRMRKASLRMMEFIEGLLALSQLNRRDIPQEKINLNAVIAGIIEDLEVGIEKKQALITVDPLPEIMAHPMQMRQLFYNLLSNGLKFNDKERPEIRVSAENYPKSAQEARNNYYRIYVADNGIGFDDTHTDKIFDLFHRVHGGSGYEGTGLGLALCKKVVENHGGSITARSQKGQGSTFTITLPAEVA
jgi:PAS domain S-box-containing protein